MSENKKIIVDPWLHKADKTKKLPKDAVFACAYYLEFQLGKFFEAIFFRRTKNHDELWMAIHFNEKFHKEFLLEKAPYQDFLQKAECNLGRACAMPKKGKTASSCLILLEHLICAGLGGGWPFEFVAAGLIREMDFKNLMARIEKELNDYKAKARSVESEIIKKARELGLNPKPTGTDPYHWQAQCPKTEHFLLISTESNEFGCGYCKRKGTTDDLVAFVKEREKNQNGISRGRDRG